MVCCLMQVAVGAPDRPEKGEDWEHEQEMQDDDLEQGEEDGVDHDLNASTKKCDPDVKIGPVTPQLV